MAYESQKKYDQVNTIQFKMKLNKNTDSDIIELLDEEKNKQGLVKSLLRDYIRHKNKP